MQEWGHNAALARATLAMEHTEGVPTWVLHLMDMPLMEHWGGAPPGAYRARPEKVYLDFQHAVGTCFIDQYIPRNPLAMASYGFDNAASNCGVTGRSSAIVLDGRVIDGPEAVVAHLQDVEFDRLRARIAAFADDDPDLTERLIDGEAFIQDKFGPDILKVPYGGFQTFPRLRYPEYGYANYFCAYALYPEVMAEDFRLQADLAEKRNRVSAQAVIDGGLPRVVRLDHDMADARGTLVDVRSLDEYWFPEFARAIRPLLDAGIRPIWHCDGNLMAMVPRLIEAGVGGFQGFQYENGMVYESICRMRDRDGGPLMIWAGVSASRTLPYGKPTDVRDELRWLVEKGPEVGLALAASCSVAPGVPAENLAALIEGLAYYRERRR